VVLVDDVDVRCSRVEVVADGAEVEDLAAGGEDDAQYNRCLASITKFFRRLDKDHKRRWQCPRIQFLSSGSDEDEKLMR
jgi:hypothetical protein